MEEIRALNATVTTLIQRIERREPAPVAAAAAADIGRNRPVEPQAPPLDHEFPATAELHAVNYFYFKVRESLAGRGEARWPWPESRSRRSLVRGSVFKATSGWCRKRSLGCEILLKW